MSTITSTSIVTFDNCTVNNTSSGTFLYSDPFTLTFLTPPNHHSYKTADKLWNLCVTKLTSPFTNTTYPSNQSIGGAYTEITWTINDLSPSMEYIFSIDDDQSLIVPECMSLGSISSIP